ncbi:hypothetical protein AB0M44_02320 [Streptosporangium subroseum]|uniref:hypothetical protein n=1 Tax=Streptosporangium subroseum TaxID=106412 RepID=UPI003449F633
MIVLDACLSPHVVMAQRDHTRLRWQKPYPLPALERVRPVAWTCFCRATVYERCEGGGRAFIRRTVQLDGGNEVLETHAWSINEARVIWTELLSGRAR